VCINLYALFIQVSKDEKNILKDVEKTEVSSPTPSFLPSFVRSFLFAF